MPAVLSQIIISQLIAMSRPIEFLRKAKHPDAKTGIRGRKTDVTLSMETAREMGRYSDGHLVAEMQWW